MVKTDLTQGGLSFIFTPKSFKLDTSIADVSEQELNRWSEEGGIPALYQAGLDELPQDASPTHLYLCQVAKAFFAELTDIPEIEIARQRVQVPLSDAVAERLLRAVPFAIGSEYIDRKWLGGIFKSLRNIFCKEIAGYDGSVEGYLTERNRSLHVPERVFFHLVENKGDDRYPFAFLATYATKATGTKVRHVPLQYALTEYREDRGKLMALLSCLNKAAEASALISDFMESGELFHPIRLTSSEAYRFLLDVADIEAAGILCRIPNWWRSRASSVTMSIKLGGKRPSMLGFDAILDMQPKLVVDGVELTTEDIKLLLAQTEGLTMLKGKWVEVNHAKLQSLLDEMDSVGEDLTLFDALRLGNDKSRRVTADVGTVITNGEWLDNLLTELRNPSKIKKVPVPKAFTATLRPYQKQGYAWLNLMRELGFGACLADDMGLGKTVQVLAFLEHLRELKPDAKCLLVVPASLLGNWQKEQERFAPAMGVMILHGYKPEILAEMLEQSHEFLTITTYGIVARLEGLAATVWDCVILDEAQAIKNPGTKQTKAVKELRSRMRIAMTGTPIENDLTNLWSLFDFLDKGLLGSSKEFKDFCSDLKEDPSEYAHLKSMVAPFMLRRLKTDKKIIADLPDKFEMVDYANLSKKQTVLYKKAVSEMEEKIESSEGIERKGLVLATIMKLKQICNHPDQYLGDTAYAVEDSGKLELLTELCETIYAKRERVLVFTQFKEITEPLAEILEQIFHAKGFVLHGGTPVKRRTEIVEAFQGEDYVPFIVLSLKAGGTGLNLTKANHVIHFDRWWNPAVEDQATDRAFRIGQTKDVLVHKLVCAGTIEEKIDEMIESKKDLADKVVGTGEQWITELSNDELISMLRLEA